MSDTNFTSKIGMPPGSLIHVGKIRTNEVKIMVFDYDKEHISTPKIKQPEDCMPFKDTPTVTWVNVDGLHETDIIGRLGKAFDLSSLILEDLLNTHQRPKIDYFDKYLFFTFKMIGLAEDQATIVSEQVSLVMGPNYVISFQEQPGDIFDPIRERILNGRGRVREKGSEYLVYLLIDIVVDNYYILTNKITEQIESLEDRLMTPAGESELIRLQKMKKDLIILRRSATPLRDAVNAVRREVKQDTARFYNDLYDHTLNVTETLENHRDMHSHLMDLYFSGISNRMNSIMQVLTIIATIFIPLTFIAGIYGMNFEVMPELKWEYGYFAVWGVMIIVVILMLWFFWRKKWL